MAQKKDEATNSPERRAVVWNTPESRLMPVYAHDVTCAFCGRHFTAELFSPIAPLYCLKADNPDCYQQRKAAYMRQYRAKKKGETREA